MRPLIPYLYRVSRRMKAGRPRWFLAVVPPRGKPGILADYSTRGKALDAANTLAIGGGMVEVRP